MGEPKDPNVEPEGYEPPQSAEELLERYAAGERYFRGAVLRCTHLRQASLQLCNLDHADLYGAVLDGADLRRASFEKADLRAADLRNANLQHAFFDDALMDDADCRKASLRFTRFKKVKLRNANLQDADLRHSHFQHADLERASCQRAILQPADFRGANLKEANFQDAQLLGAQFEGANLDGANLKGAILEKANLKGASLMGHPLRPVDIKSPSLTIGQFRQTVGLDLPHEHEGLTLYFNTRLTAFDRFLVDGVIFGVLGQDAGCHVVEFREQGDTAIVRLQAEQQEDLGAVADALYERVWEQQERAREEERTAVVRSLDGLLHLEKMGESLSTLVDRIHKMELWAEESGAKEMIEDQAAAHLLTKDRRAIEAPEKKIGRAALSLVKKWAPIPEPVKDLVAPEVVDEVKGLLPGDDE